VDLNRRLLEYYNINRLKNSLSMLIARVLLKEGFNNFSLIILEICNTSETIKREQYYFYLYSPELNILKIAGSPQREVGIYKASEESKAKSSASALA
jgi:group I intron endonuclease